MTPDPSGPAGPADPDVLATLLPGFVGTSLPPWLERRLRDGLGGVCVFGPNVVDLDALRALTDAVHAANPAALVAIDEEGGDVTRVFAHVGSPAPGNAVLGRLDDLAATAEDGRRTGATLHEAGCDLDLAPSVDVNVRADNPVIGTRSFGERAERVARHGAAWVEGLQSTGVAATAKHFPGHGDTARDSHVTLPVVDVPLDTLRDRELVPFAAAVQAGVLAVMTSHLVVPAVDDAPATMSRALLVDLLRGELGFAGLVVSDALDMAGARSVGGAGEAAVQALSAGCDLLCLGTRTTDEEVGAIMAAVTAALRDGRLDRARVADAAARVRGLAGELDRRRAATPVPAPQPSPVDDLDALAATFDVQPVAAAWGREAAGGYAVVRLEATANMAVGPTPWGPFAAVADPDDPAGAAFARQPSYALGPDDDLPALASAVLLVGRDLHRHPFARAAADALRARGAGVLVVDMGWPDPDRRYADVATFGSSRLVGRALLALLARLTGTGAGPAV